MEAGNVRRIGHIDGDETKDHSQRGGRAHRMRGSDGVRRAAAAGEEDNERRAHTHSVVSCRSRRRTADSRERRRKDEMEEEDEEKEKKDNGEATGEGNEVKPARCVHTGAPRRVNKRAEPSRSRVLARLRVCARARACHRVPTAARGGLALSRSSIIIADTVRRGTEEKRRDAGV